MSKYDESRGLQKVKDEGPLDDPVAEKLRQQRLVEEADYASTMELFGSCTCCEDVGLKWLFGACEYVCVVEVSPAQVLVNPYCCINTVMNTGLDAMAAQC